MTTPVWIDPVCGCERSPDVGREVPCPVHAPATDATLECVRCYKQTPTVIRLTIAGHGATWCVRCLGLAIRGETG
mgnify:CR=1 FL=1